MEPDARLWWREMVVLGRHEEPTGSLLQRVRLDVETRPVLRTELPVGDRWPGSSGPAGLDGARAVGSILTVGWGEPQLPSHIGMVRAAAVRLPGEAWLVTALGGASPVRGFLDQVTKTPP